ncbi:MAG: thiamine diphosphokinase [Anaerolineales bacterium]
MSRIVIFANGQLPHIERARSLIRATDEIICADGGSRHVLALGLHPALVIGDLDSIADEDRQKLEAAGIPIQRHPRDKDETDLELALHYALEQEPSTILIVAGLGGRLDHTLGNIAALSDPAAASLDVRLDDGLDELLFCRRQAQLRGTAGDLVSLVPWGVPVEGVRTSGLRWPLHSETLYPEKTRGISNEMVDEAASVEVASGLLLMIHHRQSAANHASDAQPLQK